MKYDNLKTEELLDITATQARPLFEQVEYPWEVLPLLKNFIRALGKSLPAEEYEEVSPEVWIAKTATVAPTAFIAAPTIIGPDTEVRHCAFIRGSALIGAGCVVGNSTEIKNSILFDGVQVPHYNYVGDSVLGRRAHMGAGSITSNIKADKKNIVVRGDGMQAETGLRKFGAVLGDEADVGCNTVLNPGSVVGRGTNIYPLSFVRGYVPAKSIYKHSGEIAKKRP